MIRILRWNALAVALAIAACNTVLMLEHSIYTVASPEAAASILWRDSSRAQEAATGMKITARLPKYQPGVHSAGRLPRQ